MGFKDFITNFGYRKQIAKQFDRLENIQPPSNPSPDYIQNLVKSILDPEECGFAVKELGMIGKSAGAALIAALDDPRFRQILDPDGEYLRDKPLDLVLGLLVPIEPGRVVELCAALIASEDPQVRKIAALHLTHTGRDEVGPLLHRLFSDEDFYVRSYSVIGLKRAHTSGLLTDGLRDQAYGLLLEQCNVEWPLAGNKCAGLLIELDRARAQSDLADPAILRTDNPNLKGVLDACNRASIPLPAESLRAIFEDTLPRVVGKNPYPHQYVLSETIELLATCVPEADARPLIDRAKATQHDRVMESAGHAEAKLAGIEDAQSFIFDRIDAVGYAGLTDPQRVFYLATVFDNEVCNGGIMQFFGNSSGDLAADTLDALRELGHAEAISALEAAMQAVGPLARESDRDMRLEAFADRYEALEAVFEPLESAYYETNATLRVEMNRYAAEHAEDFR